MIVDTEKKESLPDNQYLVYQETLPAEYDAKSLIEAKGVIPVYELVHILNDAQRYLEETPGPNQDFRRKHADPWLGWWSRFLSNNQNILKNSDPGMKLLTFEEVQKRALLAYGEGYYLANLFANSMEGHPGHRAAAAHMAIRSRSDVLPALLIDEEIDATKDRSARYLPLGVIMSLWAYWRIEHRGRLLELDHISLIPTRPAERDPDQYYWAVFVASLARYHYVVTGDPNFDRKLFRNPGGKALLDQYAREQNLNSALVEELLYMWVENEGIDPFDSEYLMIADEFYLPRETWMIIERAGRKDKQNVVPSTTFRVQYLTDPNYDLLTEPILDYWELSNLR